MRVHAVTSDEQPDADGARARAVATADRGAVLAELDALFAANPWEGDVTAIIREMRDSR
jgi:hypothetical protein